MNFAVIEECDENSGEYVKTDFVRLAGYDKMYTASLTIPTKVTIEGNEYAFILIGDYAFSYCSSLTSIEIPASVNFIGDNAFYDCDGLRSVIMSF